jgi:protein-tyrosine-phosphatase
LALGPDGKVQILFVCTGNLCRSPMAEATLLNKLDSKLQDRVRILSAGTHAMEGMLATLRAVYAASQYGIELTKHRSQPLTPWLISHSDLIIAMDADHYEFILHMAPTAGPRTFLLKEFGRKGQVLEEDTDVHDPISGDEELYIAIYREIIEEINRILPSIEKVIDIVG